MKFTLSWLLDYLETDATLEEISQKLTMIGLEVEEITQPAKDLAPFRVAQILDAKPHPNADSLQVCKVETGSEQLQIVCGAPNARPGINVVLAPVGSIIPTNGMKIRTSKIRGVESHGMLCSAAELGIGEDHAGIIEMPICNDNIAKEFAQVAGLDDPMIEIAITPNRGDCLGVYGIARDLAAAGVGTLKSLEIPSVSAEGHSPISTKTDDEQACPLFVGRHFTNVKNGPSPDWLQQRLKAIGLKPISALVDITNYISFSFGRPLHVYDAKKLKGDLVARFAKEGENIEALDEKTYSLTDEMLVIADDNGPQAIAGVIGGAVSGCQEGTSEVLLEVALFDPVLVAKTGRALDIITDSRYRFERSVDPGFVMDATEIASQMIIDLCGGVASNQVVAGGVPEASRTINYDWQKANSLGGIDIDEATSKEILEKLGFKVEGNQVTTPSWRADVEGQADLVEEIIRIYGFDSIPTNALPSLSDYQPPKQRPLKLIRRSLAANGLNEVISWSFMMKEKAKLFGGGDEQVCLQNPISADLDCMRPSLLPNMLDAASKNEDRGFKDVAFFEIGSIYQGPEPKDQKSVVSGIRAGQTGAKNIYSTNRPVDFYDAKQDALAALSAVGAPVDNLQITTDAPNWYHPGKSAVLKLGKTILAHVGEIHPTIVDKFDLNGPVVGFEVFVSNLPPAKNKKTTSRKRLDISEYQSSVRDFAFIVDQDMQLGPVINAIKKVDKELVNNVSLFDIYSGSNIEQGKKSVALSVLMQPKDRTLTEAELEDLSKKIIAQIEKMGGSLRG